MWRGLLPPPRPVLGVKLRGYEEERFVVKPDKGEGVAICDEGYELSFGNQVTKEKGQPVRRIDVHGMT